MQVKLWAMRTRLLSAEEEDLLLASLPIALQERLRTVDDALRQQSLWGYSLLRFALREGYDVDVPAIAWSEQGKPYFPGQREFFFNVSHTDGAVLVGLSQREIGVDLEKDREAPARLRKLLQTGEPFFAQWVRWEACAKCLGVSVLSLLRNGMLPEGIAYCEIETFPGYRAGAAVQGAEEDVTVRITEWEELLSMCRDGGKD